MSSTLTVDQTKAPSNNHHTPLASQIQYAYFSMGVEMFRELLSRWPVIRQIKARSDGTGPEAWSDRTRNLQPRIAGCEVSRGICPYCGVGCGQLLFHQDNKLVSIEGDPASPISRGHLCPKGANTHQLHTHPGRLTQVKYRRPYAKDWEDLPLKPRCR